MTECFARDETFDALIEAMSRPRRPLALLGAGTSVDSGYPDWYRLLGILEEKAKVQGISPKYMSYLRTLNDPAWQAEEYRRIIGEHAFCDVVASEFAPRGEIGETLQIVAQLGFRHLLTTNYDSCIERAYAGRGKLRVMDWAEDANLRQFFLDLSADPEETYLLYLHGRYYDPARVILTESSYAGRYMRSDDARNKLFAIFLTQPVVFIGFSVNDPDLNHLMREVNARLGTGKPQHFALIGYEVEEQQQLIRSRFQGKYGIAPVFYRITRNDDRSENHGCLVDLLSAVHQEVHQAPPRLKRTRSDGPEAAAPQPAAPPALDPLDQQKGRWGGEPARNGRVLRVENPREITRDTAMAMDLVVESTADAETPLEGEVTFHLHQTFPKPMETVEVRDGRAVLKVTYAYGAFTVGVQADGGRTRLELDLAQHPDLPKWFRER
jgi:hypothetical protein